MVLIFKIQRYQKIKISKSAETHSIVKWFDQISHNLLNDEYDKLQTASTIQLFANSQIILSIAIACANAQRFNNNAPPAAARSFEADAVALKHVFDLNPVDNSYVKR